MDSKLGTPLKNFRRYLVGSVCALAVIVSLVPAPGYAAPADGPVRGFGYKLRAQDVVPSILPHGTRFTFQYEEDASLLCSWHGGPSWQQSLIDAMSEAGLVPQFTAWGVMIMRNNAVASAAAVARDEDGFELIAPAEPAGTRKAAGKGAGPVQLTQPAQPPQPALDTVKLSDWIVRGAVKQQDGSVKAWISQGAHAPLTPIIAGQEVSGLGKINQIQIENGGWVVHTEQGWFSDGKGSKS